MDKNTIREDLIKIVNLLKTNINHQVTEKTKLSEDAGIDSLSLMEIVEKVQISNNIIFSPEEYSFENFESVGSLLALVEARKQATAPLVTRP